MKQKKQGDKSTNPNNPECSSVKQALLDLQSSGFDYTSIQTLLSEIDQDSDRREQADELFRSHKHPSHRITFSKIYNNIEFCRFLSPQAATILFIMCITMNHNNLIQLSQDDIVKITGIGNKGTVGKALNDLIESGAIAIKLKGNSRRSNVYMVNPAIANVGTEIPGLERLYWKPIDDEYANIDDETIISPHQKWDLEISKSTYSIGYNKQKLKGDQELYFNKINPPAVNKEVSSKRSKKNKGIQQKKTSGAVTPDAQQAKPDFENAISEDLPFTHNQDQYTANERI